MHSETRKFNFRKKPILRVIRHPRSFFFVLLLHLNKQIGYELNIINSKKSDNTDITDFFNQLNNSIDILYHMDMDIIQKIDLINKLKIIIYRHMKHHVIDLNDVHAINTLKDIKNERNSRSN